MEASTTCKNEDFFGCIVSPTVLIGAYEAGEKKRAPYRGVSVYSV